MAEESQYRRRCNSGDTAGKYPQGEFLRLRCLLLYLLDQLDLLLMQLPHVLQLLLMSFPLRS